MILYKKIVTKFNLAILQICYPKSTGYIIQWWVTRTASSTEMASICCNGSVGVIQLFHFFSGINSRTIKFSFDYKQATHHLVFQNNSLLYQYIWPSYWQKCELTLVAASRHYSWQLMCNLELSSHWKMVVLGGQLLKDSLILNN